MIFNDKIEVRNTPHIGVDEWYWVKSDHGAWDGPVRDWNTSHSTKYFDGLKNKRTVITAGGNCGLHVRAYADMFNTVYAFEPDAMNFHCMVGNAPFDNVIMMNAALGEKQDLINMNTGTPHNVGMHRVDGTGRIPMFTIDSLKLTNVDLIQLDVEGYEEKILDGAMETIREWKPRIILERCNGTKFLDSLGYKLTGKSVADNIFDIE